MKKLNTIYSTVPFIVESEEIIRCPPDLLFSFSSDINNLTYWHSRIESARIRNNMKLQKGGIIDFKLKFWGREIICSNQILHYTPERSLHMFSDGFYLKLETHIRWKSTSDGDSIMKIKYVGKTSLMAKILRIPFRYWLRKSNQVSLENLKIILESQVRSTAYAAL